MLFYQDTILFRQLFCSQRQRFSKSQTKKKQNSSPSARLIHNPTRNVFYQTIFCSFLSITLLWLHNVPLLQSLSPSCYLKKCQSLSSDDCVLFLAFFQILPPTRLKSDMVFLVRYVVICLQWTTCNQYERKRSDELQ